MTLIADVFPKLRAPKNMIRYLSKKTYFWGLLEKQHGKRAQTILKSEGQCPYHIYWWPWRQLRRERSLLLIWKILRVVVNTFTANGKYSLLNGDNLMQPIHMQLYRKPKNFSEVFFSIFKIYIKFAKFSKKRWPSSLMYFRNYELRKAWLDNCLKSPLSQDPSTGNMVNRTKHCWNLSDKNFTIFFDNCESNWVWKSFS